jgi:hypothetical protein
VLLLGVGITLAWQSFREEAKEVLRTWVPSLGWVLPPIVKLAASAEASPELGQQLKPIALDLALVRVVTGGTLASRCPDRFCLAASMSRSTSRSVRYCSRASTRAPQIGTQTQLVGHTEEMTAAISATGQTTCSDASTVREKLGKLMVGRWMARIQCVKFLRC